MTLLVDNLRNMLTRATPSRPQRSLWRSPSGFMSTANEPITEETCVSFSAVWRGLELLSGVMARMPKSVVRDQDDANKVKVRTHRVAVMLRRRVSPEQTSPKWFEYSTIMTMLWGQSFSEIKQNKNIVELYPLHPKRVKVLRDGDYGPVVYEYQPESGKAVYFNSSDILHITMPGFDGVTGRGLMALAKHSIGLGLALQKYGGSLFGNNAIPGTVLQHPGVLGDDGQKHIRESFEARHRGSEKAFTPLILEEGMTAQTLTPPNDALQFNETRGMQVLEIARYMGVSPHLLFWLDRSTFSNIEHQGIEFVKYTIANWICRFTSEMEVKLLDDPNLQIEIDTTEIERGDSATFSQVLERQIGNGIITFNEARRALGRNSLGPDGDVRVINKAYMLADRLEDEPPEPMAPPPPQPNTPEPDDEPQPPSEEEDDQQDRARTAAAIVLRESMQSLIGVECDRLQRTLKKGQNANDTAERVGKFYEEFAERVIVAFTPAFASFAAFTGSDDGDIVGAATEYVEAQRDSVLGEIAAGRDPLCVLETWRENRADQVTEMYFGGSNHGA